MNFGDALATTTSGVVETTTKFIGSFPLEVILISAILLFYLYISFKLGKTYTIALALSFFIVGFFFHGFLDIEHILSRFLEPQSSSLIIGETITFVVLLLVVAGIIRNIIDVDFDSSGVKKLFEQTLISAVLTSLTLIFFYRVLTISSIYTLSPQLSLFLNGAPLFWWLVVTLGTFLLVIRK